MGKPTSTFLVQEKKANDGSTKSPTTASFNIGGRELLLFLKIMRAVGLAPLRCRVEPTGRWSVTASLALRVYSLTFIFIVVLVSTYAHYVRSTLPDTGSVASRLVRLMQFLAMSSCLLAAALTLPTRTRTLTEYFEAMSQLHDRFSKDEFKATNRRMLLQLLACLVAFAAVLVQEAADDVLEQSTIDAKTILCNLPPPVEYMLCLMLEAQFTLHVWLLESRASAAIRRVDDVLEQGERQGWRDPGRVLEQMQLLHGMQTALRRGAGSVNAAFGLPMLIAVVFIMIEIIIAIYYLIVDIDAFSVRVFLLNLQWLVILVWWLMVVIEPCHQYVEKDHVISTRISAVILKLSESKIFNCDWRDESKLKIFRAQQVLLSSTEVNITALDVCVMRRSLLGSIAGAVTTYLVILLQLKDAKV